ncbi:MAG: paraslipin [Deltaproteobacteria bacterium]|nr:paraslipin [Deltaproteobacteria bacterium]
MTQFTLFILLLIYLVYKTAVIVPMREAAVKERLGKFVGVLKPGLHFLIPLFDRIAYRHEMREQVLEVETQTAITKDNIQVEVDGLLYLRVVDPEKASYGIQDYRRASVNLAQTTMRSELGKLSLDNTFSERDKLNENIVREIDRASESWGIKVLRYEIKNIQPPAKVIDTMEKQMEAERNKRAEITLATAEKENLINLSEGERQEAVNLSEGDKIRRINESQGRAKEITLLAEATALGIRRIAEAVSKPGGQAAVRMQVVDRFIDEFGAILRQANISVVPSQLANLRGFFEGIARVGAEMSTPGVQTAPGSFAPASSSAGSASTASASSPRKSPTPRKEG